MIDRNEVAAKLNILLPDSSETAAHIRAWAAVYEGRPDYLSDVIISTAQLGYSAAHEMARLVTLEFKSELSGGEALVPLWERVINDAPIYTEFACALGGVMLKPYYNGREIITDYVRADSFFPTSYDGKGNITGCIFAERLCKGREYFTRLEYHRYEGNEYVVSNSAYMSKSAVSLGRSVSLVTVPEWADMDPEARFQNISTPLYSYFRIPGVNLGDSRCPMGESIFARAMNTFKEADEQYSRILWEAQATEPAVFADVTVLHPDDKPKKKSKLSRMSNRLFKLLDVGGDDGMENMIKEYAPPIRDVSQINIFNTILRRAEFLCGLAYGTFSQVDSTEKTATEIKASKQRSYATVSAIQHSLKLALENYLETVCELCAIHKLPLEGKPKASFEFDDSLVTDAETEQKIIMQEVAAGLVSPVFYLMRRYGVTEQQALKMLPQAIDDEE